MSSLEALVAASGESGLLESLSFDLPPASSAVVDRKTLCRAYPTSASTLSPTGTRTCRIRIGGGGFVDPTSVRLVYTLTNTDNAKPLAPSTGPHGCWGLCRELSNGVELTNLPSLGRFTEMHGWRLTSQEAQFSEAVYGWSSGWNTAAHPTHGIIAAGAAIQVSHKLLTTLLTAGKLIPTQWCPIELELTCANAVDWLYPTISQIVNGTPTNVVTSTSYTVSNIQVMYNQVQTDDAIAESLLKSLLANRRLNIPAVQAFQISQAIPANSSSYTMSIVRAFSRLSHIYVTFRTATGILASEFAYPSAVATAMAGSWSTVPVFDQDIATPTIRLSLGPKNWPDGQPLGTTGVHEHYWQLMESLPHSVLLDRKDYLTTTGGSFVTVFDLRRTPGDQTSSVSSRSGDQIRLDIKGLLPSLQITEINVVAFAMCVVSVAEQGISLLD